MNDIYGLILSGGKSSRMGFDKGTIPFHGKPQREFLFDLLCNLCATVYTSCKDPLDVPPHLNPLADQYPMNSPLNGILTAFAQNPNVAWLTVPVDMPMISSETLRLLLTHRDKESLATCFYDSDGKLPEPLVTIWEPKSATFLATFYQDGGVSPRAFLIDHKIKLISPPGAVMNENINTPEELKQYFDNKGTNPNT